MTGYSYLLVIGAETMFHCVPHGAEHHLHLVVEDQLLGQLDRLVVVEAAVVIDDLDRHLLVVFRQHDAAGVVDLLRPEVVLRDRRRFRAVDKKTRQPDGRAEAYLFRCARSLGIELAREGRGADSCGTPLDKGPSIHLDVPPMFCAGSVPSRASVAFVTFTRLPRVAATDFVIGPPNLLLLVRAMRPFP